VGQAVPEVALHVGRGGSGSPRRGGRCAVPILTATAAKWRMRSWHSRMVPTRSRGPLLTCRGIGMVGGS
jgi:hypothetical protein